MRSLHFEVLIRGLIVGLRFRFKFVVIAKKDTYVYLCVSLYYYYFGNVHLQLYLLMGTNYKFPQGMT